MKFAFIIIIPFLLLACQPKTPFELDTMTPVPIQKSYISLRENNGSLIRYGSAVVIANGYAVTDRHVIEGSKQMKGYMAGGIEFHVAEIFLSDRLDLALFKIPYGIGESIKIGKRVIVGERVFGVGTSNGSTLYEGVVRKTNFLIHHVDIDLRKPSGRDTKGRPMTYGFLCEGEFKKGFSGGPLVNSRGELVGIIQGYSTELYKDRNNTELITNKSYGTAYHVQDVMDEIKKMIKDHSKTFNQAQDHVSGVALRAKTEGGSRWTTTVIRLGGISRIGHLDPTQLVPSKLQRSRKTGLEGGL